MRYGQDDEYSDGGDEWADGERSEHDEYHQKTEHDPHEGADARFLNSTTVP